MPDGVNLAVLIHQLSAQMRGSRHFILEAVQLILQSLEAGCLSFAQMLLIAAHLHGHGQTLRPFLGRRVGECCRVY